MKRFAVLFLLGAASGLAGPASAAEASAPKFALSVGPSAQQHAMSSRHRRWHDRVAVARRACPGFTVAPIAHKIFGDKRWPYVHWIGACDSLYAPGPSVTFVGYDSY
jgi:hypothetical protein